MERKLLLLGLLHDHEMYGYQINEIVEAHLGSSIQLKKPTVYKLLDQMAKDGWLTFREEREGNRPIRRVYAITAAGKDTFQTLLRELLADYRSANFPTHIALGYLDVVPPDEALVLLGKRRSVIEDLLEVARNHAEHPGSMQLVIDHQIHHLESELAWMDRVTSRFEAPQTETYGDEAHEPRD
jgi:DNA-binding PadR family transcriptional regulator